MTGYWRSMKTGDLARICQIAAICHPDYPEDDAVLAEKWKLSANTCFVWQQEKGIGGYLLAHPFKFGIIPPLNELLDILPAECDTLYIHDLAILPESRGVGVGIQASQLMVDCARRENFKSLCLVAVNGSVPFWQKNGFSIVEPTKKLKEKLLTYSSDACYMTYRLVQ